MDPYRRQREHMVESQIQARGVAAPRVLELMREIPRHEFLPVELQVHAYEDRALGVGPDQTISQPYIVAVMTEALQPEAHERILEVGTGTGYQTALLAELAGEVYTIELDSALQQRSMVVLHRRGYKNITAKAGNGFEGWQDHAPYDGIIITAAPDEIPRALVAQLKDGGRIVMPLTLEGKKQSLVRIVKKEGALTHDEILPAVGFVEMKK